MKKVAILESRLGTRLGELIARRGFTPVLAPALTEIPDVDPPEIAKLTKELAARPAQIAIFQTGVGTQALFKTTDSLGVTAELLAALEKMVVVVRGPKPTAALRARNVRIDLSAREPFTTTEVIEALRATPLAGTRAIVQRHGATNRELEDKLTASGAEVVEIPTYRWSLPTDTTPLVDLIGALERGEIAAVTFTSAVQVDHLFKVAGPKADAVRAALNRTLVASIGPVCSVALKKAGVAVRLEAKPPKLGPLVEALAQSLSA
jgi:uroporphyrinogen-III synthase